MPGSRGLAWGDAASLMLFTALGLRFHRIPLTPYEFLQTAAPLLVCWFAVARALTTYARPGAWPFLLNWLVATPVALAIRQVWLGRPFGKSFLVFLMVGGTLALIFLSAWRLAAMAARAAVRHHRSGARR